MSLPSEHQFGVDLDGHLASNCVVERFVGIAGVAGNGQEELMEVLIGERAVAPDTAIMLDGEAVGAKPPDARRTLGMCFVPEERHGHAAVARMSLIDNVVLSARVRKGLVNLGFVDLGGAERYAGEIVSEFDVRTAGVTHHAGSLSGGNLQKFIMGREIMQAPTVLVAAQPTWGVDAGAAAAIHAALMQLAKAGAAVLIISQDLDELLTISDRIAVIAEGRLTAAQGVADVTVESIGIAMGGTAEREAVNA